MLMGFTFCIPLKSKCAEDVIKAYIDHICCTFRPSRKILTDNGIEFKNKLWTEVLKKLRTEQKFTPIYSPQCNGRIEGFHKFLKATMIALFFCFLCDGCYGQEGWYPRHDPTTRLAALDAERIPNRKGPSRCVMMTLHLGRGDRGKENAVSPPQACGVSIRTRDWYFAAGSVGATKTQCH